MSFDDFLNDTGNVATAEPPSAMDAFLSAPTPKPEKQPAPAPSSALDAFLAAPAPPQAAPVAPTTPHRKGVPDAVEEALGKTRNLPGIKQAMDALHALGEEDRELGKTLWGYYPEEASDYLLEQTGSPTLAALERTFMELGSPLNLIMSAIPGGRAAKKAKDALEIVGKDVGTQARDVTPKALEGPAGYMQYEPKIEKETLDLPGSSKEKTTVQFAEKEVPGEPTYVERPLAEQETLSEDAKWAKNELEVRDAEPGGKKYFTEANGQGSTSEIVGVKSTYPDWYKALTTGQSPLTRKQIENALNDIVNGVAPTAKNRRARLAVEDAIKGRRQSETIWEEVPTTEQAFVPETTTTTERIPGATMTHEVDKGQWRWIDNPGAKAPDLDTIVNAPAEVTQSSPSRWTRWWELWKKYRGPEVPTLRAVPTTPVISAVERVHVNIEEHMADMLEQPWAKELMEIPPEVWKAVDAQAMQTWQHAGGGVAFKDSALGTASPSGYQAALEGMPKPFQDYLRWRDAKFAEEQASRSKLGLQPLPEFEGPYLPRMTDAEWAVGKQVMRQHSDRVGGELQTGVGGFGQERQFSTMLEGEANGVKYHDPRRALLYREIEGAQMRETERLLGELQQNGVLWSTKEEALAASPTGKVEQVGNLWARSAEEAEFLIKNLKEKDRGLAQQMAHVANIFLRNPSLANPYPHLLKNMLYKYGLSGGNAKHLSKDFFGYLKHPEQYDPALMASFKETMPFTKSGQTVYDMVNGALPAESMLDRAGYAAGMLNRWSSKKVFAEWDPALRFARWKQYVDKGMTPQEAANNVWIDLVRYGTRSEAVDAWKQIPTNFFVAWRVGTLRTLQKSFQSAPVRAAAFVAAVDTIRELDYRKNGRWVHLPVDYVERPIAALISDPTTAPGEAARTLLMGPGGAYALKTLGVMVKDLQESGDVDAKADLQKLFFTLSQIYDVQGEYGKFMEDGNASHLMNILGTVTLARHNALHHEPDRVIGKLIPEGLMETSGDVKSAQQKEQALSLKRERREERQDRRRDVLGH